MAQKETNNFKLSKIKCIAEIDLDDERSNLIYGCIMENDKKNTIITVDECNITEKSLNHELFLKLIRENEAIPKQLSTHHKIKNFMMDRFKDDFIIIFQCETNDDKATKVIHEFTMKPSYITGISVNDIVDGIIGVYHDTLIEPHLVPEKESVKCLYILFSFYLYIHTYLLRISVHFTYFVLHRLNSFVLIWRDVHLIF